MECIQSEAVKLISIMLFMLFIVYYCHFSYGDLRVQMGYEILAMWQNLGMTS